MKDRLTGSVEKSVLFPDIKPELSIRQIGNLLDLPNVERIVREMERCRIITSTKAYAKGRKLNHRDIIKVYAVSEMAKDGVDIPDMTIHFVGIFPFNQYVPEIQKILDRRIGQIPRGLDNSR